MRLTAYTNYALRILMFCALHPDQLVRVQDIADAYGISKAHLLKATRQLGQLGYLENVRGRNGGVRLSRPANEITIGQVAQKLEHDDLFVECFNTKTNTCPISGACKLTSVFRAGIDAFFEELNKVTLADAVADGPSLMDRFAPNRASTGAAG